MSAELIARIDAALEGFNLPPEVAEVLMDCAEALEAQVPETPRSGSGRLGSRQRALLDLIAERPGLTITGAADLMGVSTGNLCRAANVLQRWGLIRSDYAYRGSEAPGRHMYVVDCVESLAGAIPLKRLPQAQVETLRLVQERPGMTLPELATARGVTWSTILTTARRMEAKSLVRIEPGKPGPGGSPARLYPEVQP